MQFAKPISGVGSGAGGCDSLRSAELYPNKYCMCREGFCLGRAPGPCCAPCQTPPPSLIYLRGPGLGSPDSLGSSHPTGSIAAQRRPQLRPRQDPQPTPTAAARVRRRAGHEHRPGEHPKLKYLRTLYLGLQSRWQSADISMLRLLETFLKSAPQLVLQLSIMVQAGGGPGWLSASASLVSLAWMIASYQKVLRDSREDKLPMSYKGAIVQILWHLFTIAARAIAFALFASVFQLYFGIFIVTHWCIMTFWIIQGETDFCMSKWEEIIYNMVVGIIYIFCWFNVKEGRSRYRMCIYYIITLSENAALTALWFLYYNRETTSDFDALILVCVVSSSFALGIFFMFIYYCLLHPNGPMFGPHAGGCIFRQQPPPAPGSPADAVTSPPRSLPRTTGGEREGAPGDRDSCVPVFQVRPCAPTPPAARAPRTEGPVIRIDLPRKKYPAWDAHFIDRRLRKTILALEYASPTTPRLQYRTAGVSQELLEYETTV
uniref:XK-related protein n=1 Tax=Anas platyrhynchos TaxID=8839 RepID=A0A8B9SQL6_ANAPL